MLRVDFYTVSLEKEARQPFFYRITEQTCIFQNFTIFGGIQQSPKATRAVFLTLPL